MERAISILIATLLIGNVSLPTATDAQTTSAVSTSIDSHTQANSQLAATQPSPFDLTYLAYQGGLKDQGIPSYGALIDAIAYGRVTAQKLMQAAVRANRLPESTLTDRGYRSALQLQLNGLLVDN